MGPAPTPPPPEPTDASGDDIFLLTTSVSPLVVLLLDNSVSMLHVEWHPAYDPEAPLPANGDSIPVATSSRTTRRSKLAIRTPSWMARTPLGDAPVTIVSMTSSARAGSAASVVTTSSSTTLRKARTAGVSRPERLSVKEDRA